jgi:hypothetical protein
MKLIAFTGSLTLKEDLSHLKGEKWGSNGPNSFNGMMKIKKIREWQLPRIN